MTFKYYVWLKYIYHHTQPAFYFNGAIRYLTFHFSFTCENIATFNIDKKNKLRLMVVHLI